MEDRRGARSLYLYFMPLISSILFISNRFLFLISNLYLLFCRFKILQNRLHWKSFSQNWLISFFWFIAETWRNWSLWKIQFCSSLGKKESKIGYCAFYWKFCYLFFLKTMQNKSSFDSWLSIANPHIWENSCSEAISQNVPGQSDCRILESNIYKKIEESSWFSVYR